MTKPAAIRYLSRLITERTKGRVWNESDRRKADSAHIKSDDPYGFKLRCPEPTSILTFNCLPGTLEYAIFDTADKIRNAHGSVTGIGSETASHVFICQDKKIEYTVDAPTILKALEAVAKALSGSSSIPAYKNILYIGHRVLFGGEKFTSSTLVTGQFMNDLESLPHPGPKLNSEEIKCIKAAVTVFSQASHVAVFDTSFHHTLPAYAFLYGLPYEYYKKHRIRRFGYHGTQHRFAALKAAQFLQRPFNELEIITCFLDDESSMCAIDHSRSIDTTMGFTPSAGLIMGCRSGDLDPGILIHLMQNHGVDCSKLDSLINKEGGLCGISGVSQDLQDLEEAASNGDYRALRAIKTFCYNIRKTTGAYACAMQGLDAIVFTGKTGRASHNVRSLACQGLEFMGVSIDENANKTASTSLVTTEISTKESKVRVIVVPSDELRMVARETLRTIQREKIHSSVSAIPRDPIPVEVSAHHVHLSQQHVEALFGEGHTLTPESDLSQPGQFACKEKVTLIGPKGTVDRVRVLGPVRKETQVEIALTEQFKLGIHPPVRESGDIQNTPGITLEGTEGRKVVLDKGVICAMRHIHIAPDNALKLGLQDRYIVRVKIDSDRELIFGDVLVRVSPSFRLAMHIDTDEANAANLQTGSLGYIDSIQSRN